MQSTYEKSESFPDISKLNLFLKILRQEGLETKVNICVFNVFSEYNSYLLTLDHLWSCTGFPILSVPVFLLLIVGGLSRSLSSFPRIQI